MHCWINNSVKHGLSPDCPYIRSKKCTAARVSIATILRNNIKVESPSVPDDLSQSYYDSSDESEPRNANTQENGHNSGIHVGCGSFLDSVVSIYLDLKQECARCSTFFA